MTYNQALSDKVYEMYSREKIFQNGHCFSCRETNSNLKFGPIPLYHIGKDYDPESREKRLLIVGIVAYGWGDVFPNFPLLWEKINLNDKAEISKTHQKMEDRVAELLTENRYFGYINYALGKAFESAQQGYDKVAITNLVHCNTGNRSPNLPQYAKESCISINRLGRLYKEIEILKPTHLLINSQDKSYLRYVNSESINSIVKKTLHPRVSKKEDFANAMCTLLMNN